MAIGYQAYALPSVLITFAGAGGRADFAVTVENTYDFIWLDGLYSCDFAAVMAGTDVVFGGFLINVKPAAGQEKLFKDQIPIGHAFGLPGIGSGPRRMPFWARFAAGGEVTLDVTNQTGAATNARVTFFGVRCDPGATWPVHGISGVSLP